jgi:hypothetical protein
VAAASAANPSEREIPGSPGLAAGRFTLKVGRAELRGFRGVLFDQAPARVRAKERLQRVDAEEVLDSEQVFQTRPVAALDAVPASLIQASATSSVSLAQGVRLTQMTYPRSDMPKRLGQEIGSKRGIREAIHN